MVMIRAGKLTSHYLLGYMAFANDKQCDDLCLYLLGSQEEPLASVWKTTRLSLYFWRLVFTLSRAVG